MLYALYFCTYALHENKAWAQAWAGEQCSQNGINYDLSYGTFPTWGSFRLAYARPFKMLFLKKNVSHTSHFALTNHQNTPKYASTTTTGPPIFIVVQISSKSGFLTKKWEWLGETFLLKSSLLAPMFLWPKMVTDEKSKFKFENRFVSRSVPWKYMLTSKMFEKISKVEPFSFFPKTIALREMAGKDPFSNKLACNCL